MDKFLNMVRSLYNIDGYQLPELSKAEQAAFVRDPAHFFIAASGEHQAAIWREVTKRQS